ncbi:Spy/CpxP family protein refolding chaperone [Leptolyngbya sp. PCC 6406]|uniref:Spy/CpxP family protein refolding chaperone n=1 Tax=Leptolyngbya sp. PCC 6406 TaxID=1173264 RepID=UPI0002AC00F3|nr:Spy/CpxP family protein refolding chaperone [Leptolyngbya sp. PCC 6406]
MKRLLTASLVGLLGAVTLGAATLVSQPHSARANGHPGLETLELSSEQRTAIGDIFARIRAEVETLLTDEQKAAFTAALSDSPNDSPNYWQAFQAANLSDDQKAAVREIMATAHGEIGEVLTDEQRQELQEAMGARRGNGHGARGRGGPNPEAVVQALATLDLTTDQKSQIQEVVARSRTDAAALLTAEQQATFAETFAETQSYWQAFTSITLSDEQKAGVRTVMMTAREEITEVLTAEQRQQLREALMAQHRDRGARRPR